MITLIPVAGLGNRIRVVCSFFKYASEHDVPLKVRWVRERCFNASFHDLFEETGLLDVNDDCLVNRFIYSLPSRSNLYMPWFAGKITGKRAFFISKDQLDSVDLSKDVVISTWCQQYGMEKVGSLMVPTRQIRDVISSLTDRFSDHVIGVHIRRTDNAHSIAAASTATFTKRLDAFFDSHDEARAFLCTDDPLLKKELVSRYGSRLISYDSVLNRNTVQGIRDAVVELWTLASTNEIWGSYYSSYTEIASFINGTRLTLIKDEMNAGD